MLTSVVVVVYTTHRCCIDQQVGRVQDMFIHQAYQLQEAVNWNLHKVIVWPSETNNWKFLLVFLLNFS